MTYKQLIQFAKVALEIFAGTFSIAGSEFITGIMNPF